MPLFYQQTNEYNIRSQLREDELDYIKECEERAAKEIAAEKARVEARAKKIDEIKKWRL